MKRIVGIVLVLLLVTTTVLAEGVDFTTLTLEELISYRNTIVSEINSRYNNYDNVLLKGVYVGGKTIKSGLYLFTGISRYTAQVLRWDDAADYRKSAKVTFGFPYNANTGESVFVTIDEGTVIEVTSGVFDIQEITAPDWMP